MLRTPSMSQAFLLLVASLLVCLLVMEGLVRAFVPVRNVGPSFTTYDPIYGKRLKANFDTRRLSPEFEMQFSTNALGFRGPSRAELPDRPILFVGDSFTMGHGVSDGEEFPALIRAHLVQNEGDGVFPVVNLGIGDNGNGRPLKYLRDEAVDLEPRLVVLEFHWNDFLDNHRERLFALDKANGELLEFDAPPAGKAQRIQAWVEAFPGLAYSHLVGLARQLVTEALWARSAPERPLNDTELQERDQLTYRLIEELYALTTARGWPVVALTVGIGDDRLSVLRELGDHYDIDLIAIPGRKEQPDLYYDVDGHWTAGGHAHVADQLTGWLEANREVWTTPSANP